jgi:hypothetical protein
LEFLSYLEQTAFFAWVRESRSLLAYPGILLLHTLGMAVVVGLIAGIDLRILGFAPALPLAPLRKFLPLVWAAFAVNAVTGVILLAADATTKLTNPDFFVKMGFIFLAVILQRLIDARVFPEPMADRAVDDNPIPRQTKVLAATSLVCWLGAITAGRLLAYVGPVSGL